MGRTGVALLLVALITGCGGKTASHRPTSGTTDGAALFASSGCGGCHTLAAAKSHGTTGPNLDQLAPAYDRIVKQVQNGGGGMPSFRAKLSAHEIQAVALEDAGAASVRLASRADADWPPAAGDATILVNATPLRDEAPVAPHRGLQVVDLAYRADGRPTALVAAAREAGCTTVVDGLEILVRQGAASFELWTGVAAPVDVMRAAVARIV